MMGQKTTAGKGKWRSESAQAVKWLHSIYKNIVFLRYTAPNWTINVLFCWGGPSALLYFPFMYPLPKILLHFASTPRFSVFYAIISLHFHFTFSAITSIIRVGMEQFKRAAVCCVSAESSRLISLTLSDCITTIRTAEYSTHVPTLQTTSLHWTAFTSICFRYNICD